MPASSGRGDCENDAQASGGCIRSRGQNMAGSFQAIGAGTDAVFRTAKYPAHALTAAFLRGESMGGDYTGA